MNYGGPHRIFCPHDSSEFIVSPSQLLGSQVSEFSPLLGLHILLFTHLSFRDPELNLVILLFLLGFRSLFLPSSSPKGFASRSSVSWFPSLCSLLFTPYSSSLRPLLSLHRGIAKLIVGFAFFLGFQNFYPLFLVSSPPHSIQWFSLFPAFHPLFSPISYLASKLFRPISCKWILQCLFPKKDQNDASLHLEDESKKKFWKAWWNLSAQLQEWRVGG